MTSNIKPVTLPQKQDVGVIRRAIHDVFANIEGHLHEWDDITDPGGLDPIQALTPAADRLPYYTGATTAALATFTSFARTLVDDADAATARGTLGLRDLAVRDAGTGLVVSGNDVNLDLNELGTVTVDGAADFVAIVDATDNSSKKVTAASLVASSAPAAHTHVWADVTDVAGSGTSTWHSATMPIKSRPWFNIGTDTTGNPPLLYVGDGGAVPASAGTTFTGAMDARGLYAVDLQAGRTNATQVASGDHSFIGGSTASRTVAEVSAILASQFGSITNTSAKYSAVVASALSSISASSDKNFMAATFNSSISGTASRALCMGGQDNAVSAYGAVLFGEDCSVAANYSVAMGRRSKITGGFTGSFVFSDSQNSDHSATAADRLHLRFQNGVHCSNALRFGASSALEQGTTTRIDGSGNGTLNALTLSGGDLVANAVTLSRSNNRIQRNTGNGRFHVSFSLAQFADFDWTQNLGALNLRYRFGRNSDNTSGTANCTWYDHTNADLPTIDFNCKAGAAVFNEQGSASGDFRVEGDTDANLFFSDASADSVGIGTATPSYKLDVNGTANSTALRTSGTVTVGSHQCFNSSGLLRLKEIAGLTTDDLPNDGDIGMTTTGAIGLNRGGTIYEFTGTAI